MPFTLEQLNDKLERVNNILAEAGAMEAKERLRCYGPDGLVALHKAQQNLERQIAER